MIIRVLFGNLSKFLKLDTLDVCVSLLKDVSLEELYFSQGNEIAG